MRISLVTALLCLTLLCQVWGAPKTFLVETKDEHEDGHEDAANEFGVRELRKFGKIGILVFNKLGLSCAKLSSA